MFETSVVRERAVRQQHWSVFAVSLFIHTAIVAGAVVLSIRSTTFPTRAPAETLPVFMPTVPRVEVPLPRGNPNAPRTPAVQQPQPRGATPVTTAPPLAITAPETIPDTVTPASGEASPTAAPGNPGPETWGVPEGSDDGIDTGQSESGPVAPAPNVIYRPGAEVKPAVVLSRVQPEYPMVALKARMSGIVVIECVIGKDGRPRDAHVVSSSFAAFEQPALNAMQRWRFAPGSMRGQPVDTYFELTIRFTAQ